MKISYPYGEYEGSGARQGMPHGKGKMCYKNGDVYDGQWEYGKKTYGKMIYRNGEVYEGEWKDEKPHGKGKYYSFNGVYEGGFADGKRNGYGEFKFTLSSGLFCGCSFYGLWSDGRLVGKAKAKYSNGDSYEGEITDFFKNGKGVMTYQVGKMKTYDGEWRGDKRDGYGVAKYCNGDVYEGEFRSNSRHGKGKMIFADGRIYVGEWADGGMHGTGIMIGKGVSYRGEWEYGVLIKRKRISAEELAANEKHAVKAEAPMKKTSNASSDARTVTSISKDQIKADRINFRDGAVYIGETRDGKPHGKGRMVYFDCTMYVGEWYDGQRHGFGQCRFSDRRIYEGSWKKDAVSGDGALTYPDGKVIRGNWQGIDNAANAVRRIAGDEELGKVENGEFIPDDVKAASVSECIAAAIENIRGAFGEGFQCLEENESFEDAVNDITISLIASEANKTRASARESAAKLVEMLDALKRAVSRAEISLTKLSDENFDKLKKDLSSDGEDE